MNTLLVYFLFLVFPLCALAQDITLRLIDAKTGKPLRKVPVTMFSWNGPTAFRPDDIPKDQLIFHGITDSEGRAIFSLPRPLLAHIGFSVGTPVDFAGCWHIGGDVSPEKVLQSGLVAEYDESRCGKLRTQVSKRPGEVVVVERRLTVGEKIRREIPGAR